MAGSSNRQVEPAAAYVEKPVVNRPVESHESSSPRGMVLAKKAPQKKNNLAQVLKEEDTIYHNPQSSGDEDQPVVEKQVATHGVHVSVSETVSVIVQNDGGFKEDLEVKGELAVTVYDERISRIAVHVAVGANKNFQLKTHPNINKPLFTKQSVLALKDTARNFPNGTPAGILKWRFTSGEDDQLPLSVNCWPSTAKDGLTYVNIEYEKRAPFDLHNVVIAIPVPDSPDVGDIEGVYQVDNKRNLLLWKIALIDESNSSGNMEFNVPATPNSFFFPLNISFTAQKTFCDIQVLSVVQEENGQEIAYSQPTELQVENYQIV